MDDAPSAAPAWRRHARRAGRWSAIGALVLAAALAVAALLLDSAFGHRFLVDRIAALAPHSGLRIRVGRIEGSVYHQAVLRDITLSDAQGPFLTVPVAELDWRPFAWLRSGLDVRALTLHRGRLLRAPAFHPGDPNAPTLPDYPIRVDKLVLDGFTVEPGVLGERRRIDLTGRADIAHGHALADLTGRLGGGDRLTAHLDSEPDRDKFELAADYAAPRGGLLAALTGANAAVTARVGGRGGWHAWQGFVVATRGGAPLAALTLGNRAGQFAARGLVHPQDLPPPLAARLLGPDVAVDWAGPFANRVLGGRLVAVGAGLTVSAAGALDLAHNTAQGLGFDALLTRPALLAAAPRLEGARLTGTANGPFTALAIAHRLTIARIVSGTTVIDGVVQQGLAQWGGRRLTVPLTATVARVTTGAAALDRGLVRGRIGGLLTVAGATLTSDRLAVEFPGAWLRPVLRGDLARGGFGLAGPLGVRGLMLADLGTVDAAGTAQLRFGARAPLVWQAQLAGTMPRIGNATLASLTGGNIRFAALTSGAAGAPILFRNARLVSRQLTLAGDGRRLADGRTLFVGRGRHATYGPFTIDASVDRIGPHAALVFADPYPAAGLKAVRVGLAPIRDGFRIETTGGSRLGPFAGTLALFAGRGAPTRIVIERLKVTNTAVTGVLALGPGGVNGRLALAGGGVNGTLGLAAQRGGQGIAAQLAFADARFGGDAPIGIRRGTLAANGLIARGASTIDATLHAEGVSSGQLFIGRLAGHTHLVNGRGDFTLSVAGRRGTRFALQSTGTIAPEAIALIAGGEYAGRPLTMPRRAVLTREGAGWRLAPTQVSFAGGVLIASGHVLGGPTALELQLAHVPLALADIAVADLGLGGVVSGTVHWHDDRDGAPIGAAQLLVKGLTRSGLVFSSSPLDVALVGALDPQNLQFRAVLAEGGATRGRIQGRIAALPRGGAWLERLRGGTLTAQARYSGPADALWRLTGIEVFDLTGPVGVVADVAGSLDAPRISGAVASSALRLQSAVTGADLTRITASGSFDGSRLWLARFAGQTPGGGSVSGSGTIDLSNLATQGVALDLRLAAAHALILNRDEFRAAVTGPIRLVSDGQHGTIAGRVRVDEGLWRLGKANPAQDLPRIRTREKNLPVDAAPPRAAAAAWRYLIDAVAPEGMKVRGMGLDSEWSADVRLRGTTADPVLLGGAELVQGQYEFAGKPFDLTRGHIRFGGEAPPDPQLDIAASGDANGVSAQITIAGSAQHPEIAFTSTPALPQDELLSRLLFGSSITQISAPEAVQLAAALAALHGDGGLDPINKLRSAVGLDRLRVLGADPTIGRGVAVAGGKYLGRRLYVELITDGQGYSATSIEFRITRWLALLGAISTVGEQNVNIKASKDY